MQTEFSPMETSLVLVTPGYPGMKIKLNLYSFLGEPIDIISMEIIKSSLKLNLNIKLMSQVL